MHARWMTVVVLVATSQIGCAVLARLATMMPPPTKKVPAEFSRLSGSKVLVHVWVEPGAIIDYPWARYELAEAAAGELASKVRDIDLIEPVRVEDFLESSYENAIDPVLVGRKFAADLVVYLEVSRLSMRDPVTPQLFRGRIHSSLVVYDLTTESGEPQRFELTPIEVAVPKERAIGAYDAHPLQLRMATYSEFAAAVAQRFYEHEVEI